MLKCFGDLCTYGRSPSTKAFLIADIVHCWCVAVICFIDAGGHQALREPGAQHSAHRTLCKWPQDGASNGTNSCSNARKQFHTDEPLHRR